MRLFAMALGALFVLGGASPRALGGGEEPGTASADRGRLLYRLHCGACHGASATGNGPIAEDLRVEPADLTAIAASRNGEFPRDEIGQIIDGRSEIGAHGTREMPVWGLSLRDLGRDDDQEQDVAAQIDLLLDYLISIQEPPLEAGD